MSFRAKILWIDDEIEYLKPHILYLQDKGFDIKTASSGRDGIYLAEKTNIDLALIDQYMPGIDGIDTLRKLKKNNPAIPVIMVTKSEEEILMDEAISEKVTQFLIKPVKPSQVFIAIKQILEASDIQDEKTTKDFLKEYQSLKNIKLTEYSINDWWTLYQQLVKWQLELDLHKESGLKSILSEEIQNCNHEFSIFIQNSFPNWVNSNNRPNLSVDILKKVIFPELGNGKKVCFLVMDCLRYDQFYSLIPILSNYFNIDLSYHVALLPSSTVYCRNALFSGLFYDELIKKYPQQLAIMNSDENSQNQFENLYLSDAIKRNALDKITTQYYKVWSSDYGIKFKNRIGELKNIDFLAIVVNFVDQLAHKQSESLVLKEMVNDESAFCRAIYSWFLNSWLLDVLKYIGDNNYKIVLTSDHGSIRVRKGLVVKADKNTTSGIRYKVGRNLNCDEKGGLKILSPSKFRLPDIGPQSTYLLAKDSSFFLYPNQMKKFQDSIKGSFQHGGISMEEMLVPVAILDGK